MPVLQGLRPLLHSEPAPHAGHESALEPALTLSVKPEEEHHRQIARTYLSVQDAAALHLAAATACQRERRLLQNMPAVGRAQPVPHAT